jgi:hypothetical protein
VQNYLTLATQQMHLQEQGRCERAAPRVALVPQRVRQRQRKLPKSQLTHGPLRDQRSVRPVLNGNCSRDELFGGLFTAHQLLRLLTLPTRCALQL